MIPLPTPAPAEALAWTQEHLGDLVVGPWRPSGFPGGQSAADRALAGFDAAGYAARRNEVWPAGRRGSSRLSPYIRHGLITLRRAWDAVDAAPERDRDKFRDELLWQEYARHVYARLGSATRRSLRFAVAEHDAQPGNPWTGDEPCVSSAWAELQETGWITNQQRMWLASHWTVRHERGWRDGEDLLYRHLLDGSRAANRLGWQWTVGALTGKPYGFSRWQVEKRSPGLCLSCPLAEECPLEEWPPDDAPPPRPVIDPRVRRDGDAATTAGPDRAEIHSPAEAVWITAESLGDEDPAVGARPDLPVLFVFDSTLLARLRLAPARLVFLAETLADLATRREVRVWRGDPGQVLAGVPVAATFTPVPGWRRLAAGLTLAEVHPWPWLRRPDGGSVTSFTAWSRPHGSGAGRRRRG